MFNDAGKSFFTGNADPLDNLKRSPPFVFNWEQAAEYLMSPQYSALCGPSKGQVMATAALEISDAHWFIKDGKHQG